MGSILQLLGVNNFLTNIFYTNNICLENKLTDLSRRSPLPDPLYRHLDSLEWETPRETRPEVRALAEQGIAAGAQRSRLTTGQMGFHSALNEMPAGFEVPPHSHDIAELFVVLSGSCTVADGTLLAAGDVAAIPAGMEYGFRVGDEGLRFVVVRSEDARTTLT